MLNQRATIGSGTSGEWHVEIATPDGEHLNSAATLVELNTTDGQIGVMPGHERLMTILGTGELVIHNGAHREVYFVGGGFAQIHPGRITVLAYSLEHAHSAALEKCRTHQQEYSDKGDGDEFGGATSAQDLARSV